MEFTMKASIRSKVLKKITPSQAEQKKVEIFSDNLMKKAKEISILHIDGKAVSLSCHFAGSLGKGTWLSGDHDIDLFIVFPHSVQREELEKRGMEIGTKLASAINGKAQIKYAEHPYVKITAKGYSIDAVPCYEMKMGDSIKSAVDRSPLHLEFVKQNIGGKEADARLLKKFCKAAGVYGSDAKHLGISGYICELLIIKYGSFDNAIKEISKLHPGHIIEWKHIIDKNKFDGQPFVVIDPVDHTRNAASVMSGENFIKLVETAKEFLKKPSLSFFEMPKKIPLGSKEINIMIKRKTFFAVVCFKRPDVIDDIAYPQARRLRDRLESLLRHNEFLPLHAYEYVDDKIICIILELEIWSLPAVKRMPGPPIFSQKHTGEFISKYGKNAYAMDNFWYSDVQRKFEHAGDVLKDFFKNGSGEQGVPKYLLEESKKAKIISGNDFWKFVKRNKLLSAQLREHYVRG
ncbi:MAG TPA: CCA tRNA nucleotidyltransferase [archaeon]|nr:CCA tRNA nucleotidyltransferase [archaeon]